MVKVIRTEHLAPNNVYEGVSLPHTHGEWIYNGLDCCLTHEIFDTIEPQLDEHTRATYEFSKSLQAPILEMNMRGVKIDEPARQALITHYEADIRRLESQLRTILAEGLGIAGFNWNSPAQLISLFYTTLSIPPITKRNDKGQYVPTVNREALEKLRNYFHAKPIVAHILKLRDLGKRVGTLRTEIDNDSRIRTSYNIAGTTTGRLSSSFNDFGSGTNLQNIEQRLRRIFISDPGYKFANIDLSAGDSRGVAGILWNLFKSDAYLNACNSGDLHTAVCRLAWRDLPWTGDAANDRAIADQPAYRSMSYRDLAKRLGHGTNYMGSPHTMARHSKMEVSLIQDFQYRYFKAFPLQEWHAWVRSELLTKGYLFNLFGRKRWFFGRRNDDATAREAVAYAPQSTTADAIDRGLLNVWRRNNCQVLLQVHDSVLVQYPEEAEDEVLPVLLALIEEPIPLLHGRDLIIPAEAKVGWNWADVTKDNPDGLVKYKGHDERVRTNQAVNFLDRRL